MMFQTQNIKDFNVKLVRISKELLDSHRYIKTDVGERLLSGANDIRNDIMLSMRNTKRAPWFYSGGRGGKRHYPSAPGNPPAIDKGNMAASILFDVEEYKMTVGSILNVPPYPEYLEEGTKRMKARPWLEPAVERNEPKIVDGLGEVIPDIADKIFRGVER